MGGELLLEHGREAVGFWKKGSDPTMAAQPKSKFCVWKGAVSLFGAEQKSSQPQRQRTGEAEYVQAMQMLTAD